ncbi:MAG: FkbM family methyltransferase, partial [Kofleriaceae bacterium]|nr:FkbM family methyltransferase [Kofleriaceae bacterium]
HPMHLRTRSSDVTVFEQVFVHREYEFPMDFTPGFVIDAGANIGCASVYFANRFPEARIVAIEPEPANFALLSRNLAPYGDRVRLVEAGLWDREASLRVIEGEAGASWAFRVEECAPDAPDAVLATSLDAVAEPSRHPTIDLLKIDIEGAERQVFSASCDSWLKRTRLLVIETHDALHPGCTAAVETAAQRFPHQKTTSGENLVYVFGARDAESARRAATSHASVPGGA